MTTSLFNPTLAATWQSGCSNPVVTVTTQPQAMFPASTLRLAANSGLKFNCHGELEIDCSALAAKCGFGSGSSTNTITGNNCQFQWTVSPQQVVAGGLVTFTATGLQPLQAFQVLVTGNNAEYVWQISANAQGKVLDEKLQMPLNGALFTFKPLVAGCSAIPAQAQVMLEVCNAMPIGNCNGTVTITPIFAVQQTTAGQSTILSLVISNTNTNPVTNVTLPAISLPASLTGQIVSFSQVSVPGNSQITRSFNLIPVNATSDDVVALLDIPSNTATYTCGGQTFSAGGGQTSVTIKGGVQTSCSLEIQSLSISPNPAVSGSSFTATLVVRNSGNGLLSNTTLTSLLFDNPPTVTATPANAAMSFSGIAIAAGATHTETKQFVLTKSAGGSVVHTITIPANAVTATCNGALVGNVQPYSTTVVIN